MLRHSKIKKLFASLLTISMFTGVCAYADVLTYSYKQVNDAIVVSGTVGEGTKNIEVALISDAKSFDNTLVLDDIASMDQIDLNGETTFTFSLPIDTATGVYKVRLNGQDFNAPTDFTVNYAALSDFAETLADVKNNLTTVGEFTDFLSSGNNAFELGCSEVPEGTTQAQVAQIVYDELKDNIDSVTSINEVIDMWNNASIIAAIKNGLMDDITDYERYIDLTDGTVAEWYNHVISQNGALYLTGLVNRSSLQSPEDFDEALVKALIVSVVKYPNGNSNIGKVLTDFNTITGIRVDDETKKYAAVSGKGFASYQEFITFFNNLDDNSNQNQSQGSSGNSGGNMSSIYPTQGDAMQTIEMKFVDLHTVPWAYEAISSLFDKGIINGVSETRFMPDEAITREQVAKILVCTLHLENSPYGQNFNDVDSSAWYSKYVNIAFETGICSGMDNGKFGVGLPITRQDMAVMVYNAMKIKAFRGNTNPTGFADGNNISAYASDAVSALVNHGAVNGMDGNKFEPKGTATRAQFAKVVFGVLDILR